MVYYYTSRNVKLIQSIMQDYRALSDITPYEYVCSTLAEGRFQNIDGQKVQWVIHVFLGVHKHSSFLKNIVREVGKLSYLEEDYFVIITYGMLFQITPKNALDVFKCLCNLSKSLLNAFIIFFINENHVSNISQKAQNEYDKSFVTENILGPVLSWHPHLIEIAKTYSKYLNKIQKYHQKSNSQINRNAANISKNEDHKNFARNVKFKVFTNIKLKQYNNKSKHIKRLRLQKNTNQYNYFTEKNARKNSKKEICTKKAYQNFNHTIFSKETPTPMIKSTKSDIKRLNNNVKKCEQNEVKWLYDIIDHCQNTLKVRKLLEYDYREQEKDRLINMKKNHLMGRISHEDAIIAKKNVHNENKRKYNEFIKEKEVWEKEIQDWKLKQTAYNRKQVEKMSLLELNLLNSKNSNIERKKEMAEMVRYDTKVLKEQILKNKEADLERRIIIIKEIKTLSAFAKKSRMVKIKNLNVDPAFGFLCEMSTTELRKKLDTLKMSLQKELDEKRNRIKTLNIEKKKELEVTKKSNDIFMAEKERIRHLKKSKINIDVSSTDEISKLEKMLQKRQNQRRLLTNHYP